MPAAGNRGRAVPVFTAARSAEEEPLTARALA